MEHELPRSSIRWRTSRYAGKTLASSGYTSGAGCSLPLRAADTELARLGRPDPAVAHLLTIPGFDAAVALGVLATIGDISRFPSPARWHDPEEWSIAAVPVSGRERRVRSTRPFRD